MSPGKTPPNHNSQSALWEAYRKLEPYLGLGVSFSVTILVFLFLGRWLDQQWGTSPWLLISGAALGLILGFIHMISTLNTLMNEEKSSNHSGDSTE